MFNQKIMLFAITCTLIGTTNAMDMKVVEKTVIMSGAVMNGDLGKFESVLSENPSIETVVLRNSHGGDVQSGYRIGEMIRARGLSTALSGYCISSCSRMFLGGKQRRFTDDYKPDKTFVGFHGHYDSNGNINRQEVYRNGLFEWVVKYSDGKADKELVKKWVDIYRANGMVAFMHPSANNTRNVKAFFCQGNEQKRPMSCEALDADALMLGVITDIVFVQSADRAELLRLRQINAIDSGYANINDSERVPLDSSAGIDNYKKFLQSDEPKAFAVAKNRKHWAWNSGAEDAEELALKRCEDRSGQKCILYAVDGTVVYQGQ